MNDLVQRLRAAAYRSGEPIRFEAADEIERLRALATANADNAAELTEERDSLRAQLAARDRDVERYRWLRARKPGGKYRIAGLIYSDGDEHFDAAIDAAMAKAER